MPAKKTPVYSVRITNHNGPCCDSEDTPVRKVITFSQKRAVAFLLDEIKAASNGSLKFNDVTKALAYIENNGSINGFEFSFTTIAVEDEPDN